MIWLENYQIDSKLNKNSLEGEILKNQSLVISRKGVQIVQLKQSLLHFFIHINFIVL